MARTTVQVDSATSADLRTLGTLLSTTKLTKKQVIEILVNEKKVALGVKSKHKVGATA